jgi:hypothetical protein
VWVPSLQLQFHLVASLFLVCALCTLSTNCPTHTIEELNRYPTPLEGRRREPFGGKVLRGGTFDPQQCRTQAQAVHFELYRYDPSMVAAVIFIVLFIIITVLHLYQMDRTKSYTPCPLSSGVCSRSLDISQRVNPVSTLVTSRPY